MVKIRCLNNAKSKNFASGSHFFFGSLVRISKQESEPETATTRALTRIAFGKPIFGIRKWR
jgi:hypothetical protein